MLSDYGMLITLRMTLRITVFEVRYAQRLRYVNYVTHDDYVLVLCKGELCRYASQRKQLTYAFPLGLLCITRIVIGIFCAYF